MPTRSASLVLVSSLLVSVSGFVLGGPSAQAAATCTTSPTGGTCIYVRTGAEQTFVVPPGVDQVTVMAVGGAGGAGDANATTGRNAGGRGARVSGTVAVSAGSTLYVEVGDPGADGVVCRGGGPCSHAFNGGGSGGAGGGGASDVRTGPRSSAATLGTRLLVAGGGGGAAGNLYGQAPDGGDAGVAGGDGSHGGGGGAGTGDAGGAGGSGDSNPSPGGTGPGGSGSFGTGGDAEDSSDSIGGGGGGGGYYGGGAGGGHGVNSGTSGAGGGGSSLVPAGGTSSLTTDSPTVVITWVAPKAPAAGTTLVPQATNARLGRRFHAAVTLTSTGHPTGVLVFSLYRRHDPSCTRRPVRTRVVAVNGAGDYRSAPVRRHRAGRFQWIVTYSGDVTHLAAAAPCGEAASRVRR